MSKNKNPIQVLLVLTEQALLLTIAIATIGAAVIEIMRILSVMTVNLSDLFLLFIYAEVLGMVGVFYKENRIPVTLPLIIAITALTRMIVIQTTQAKSQPMDTRIFSPLFCCSILSVFGILCF